MAQLHTNIIHWAAVELCSYGHHRDIIEYVRINAGTGLTQVQIRKYWGLVRQDEKVAIKKRAKVITEWSLGGVPLYLQCTVYTVPDFG